ncbi:MAG: hypothetical protein ACERKN_09665 [Velocimicrobium sp.]
MKKLTRVICVVAFCLVAMMGMSNVSNASTVEYTDNVIPVMTSNTSPSGKASASTEWTNGTDYWSAYKVFNHDDFQIINDGWGSAKGYVTGWLSYEFTEKKCITKYSIISRNVISVTPEITVSTLPKTWTFEAWDEQSSNWIILDKQNDVSGWQLGVKKEFEITNNNYYYKYRINITANGGYTYFTTIGELEMMETKSFSDYEGDSAILEIAMTNGTIKEYSLTNSELESFLTWYDNRSDGTGKSYYRIPKKSNIKPFLSRKEYLSFDKIYSFEVKNYNE